jgi:hypothetical protein
LDNGVNTLPLARLKAGKGGPKGKGLSARAEIQTQTKNTNHGISRVEYLNFKAYSRSWV